MKHIFSAKTLTLLLMAAIILAMMAATVVEKIQGSSFVMDNIYGAWWFILLWGLLGLMSLWVILSGKMYRRLPLLLLHFSFLFILTGAAVTFFTARRGTVHLREGEQVGGFITEDGRAHEFPFSLQLLSFSTVNYPGTTAPMDYESRIRVISPDGEETDEVGISMNNIATVQHYRFFQTGYDSDGRGTIVGVSHDPWGTGITYTGYYMLFLGLLWTLFYRGTRLRSLFRQANRLVCIAALMLLTHPSARAASSAQMRGPRPAIDTALADSIGCLYVLFGQRICPVNTLAVDFVTKLSGKPRWDGLSANEILTGWMFHFSHWETEPLIRIKDRRAQQLLGIKTEWASFDDFWNEYNEYKLERPLSEAYSQGNRTELRHLQEADEKFNLIRMFYSGELLKIFPYESDGQLQWYSPGSKNLPQNMPQDEWFFVRKSMDYLAESVVMGRRQEAAELVGKIRLYQQKRAGDVLPGEMRMQAEILYNTLASTRWIIFLSLALGILFFLAYSVKLAYGRTLIPGSIITLTNALLFLLITVQLALRWYVSGHVPLSNGYETMTFMSWATLLSSFLLQRKFHIVFSFTTLLSGLSLLVAMLGQSNPQITHLMPVLQSPLLSIHVMVIMFSYSLFAMTLILAILWFMLAVSGRKSRRQERKQTMEGITALSNLLLYPAVFLLSAGIFIGAIWANVSWGRYWGWDPKEVWALITMLVYAMPLHATSLPWFRRQRNYHTYVLLAFLSILMTYFGVNFFLGGMHSYA